MREAGGYATDLAGAHGLPPSGDVLAANDHLYPQLLELIGKARAEVAVAPPASLG